MFGLFGDLFAMGSSGVVDKGKSRKNVEGWCGQRWLGIGTGSWIRVRARVGGVNDVR